jgi:hypothetical protein
LRLAGARGSIHPSTSPAGRVGKKGWIMPNTFQEIAAERTAAKQERDARLAQWTRQKETDAKYNTAWTQFITACYLNASNATAGGAILELARLIVERDKLERLQEIDKAFSGRTNEPAITAILLEATDGKAKPSILGKKLNATRAWADQGALSDAADTVREALRAKGFSPPPRPEQAKPPRRASPEKVGPEPPNHLWWNNMRRDLDIDEGTAPWRLLRFVWGKNSIQVADVAAAVWKNKLTKYSTMKPTVTRLNQAIGRAHLPFTWTKKRGENTLVYNGPPLPPSVAE